MTITQTEAGKQLIDLLNVVTNNSSAFNPEILVNVVHTLVALTAFILLFAVLSWGLFVSRSIQPPMGLMPFIAVIFVGFTFYSVTQFASHMGEEVAEAFNTKEEGISKWFSEHANTIETGIEKEEGEWDSINSRFSTKGITVAFSKWIFDGCGVIVHLIKSLVENLRLLILAFMSLLAPLMISLFIFPPMAQKGLLFVKSVLLLAMLKPLWLFGEGILMAVLSTITFGSGSNAGSLTNLHVEDSPLLFAVMAAVLLVAFIAILFYSFTVLKIGIIAAGASALGGALGGSLRGGGSSLGSKVAGGAITAAKVGGGIAAGSAFAAARKADNKYTKGATFAAARKLRSSLRSSQTLKDVRRFLPTNKPRLH